MDAGPIAGVTAWMSVSGPATAARTRRSAVIDAVVFGLTTQIRITGDPAQTSEPATSLSRVASR